MRQAAEGPLKGLRVLAIEQYGAGPFASMYLADMGAEVIKIEDPGLADGPGGDSARASGPHFLGDNDSAFFQTFNLGKRSLALSIRDAKGRQIFEDLVKTSDVVLNNLRGDQPEKLGLTYEALKALNPRLICSHLSGYGRQGPRATWPAYDYLLQAEAGYLSLTGEPEAPPTRFGLSMVDYMTGMTLAFATSAAVIGALKSGVGQDVDVSLYDVAMHQLTYPATWYLNEGDLTSRRPRSGHPSAVPVELFPTKDGHLFIMCILPKFWQTLCEKLDRACLLQDPRFATPASRRSNRDALATLLDARLQQETTAHWMDLLAGLVPVAPVLNMAEALDNPYFLANEGVQEVDHLARAGLRVLSNPIRLNGARIAARTGPSLGQDTQALLQGLGLSPAQIEALNALGIVRQA